MIYMIDQLCMIHGLMSYDLLAICLTWTLTYMVKDCMIYMVYMQK